MKTLSPQQVSALADPNTIMTTIWDIVCLDGTVFRMTDYDSKLTIGGNEYVANGSTERSSITLGTGTAAGTVDIEGLLYTGLITESAIRSGKLNYADILISAAFVNAIADPIPMTSGKFGEIVRSEGKYKIEINNLNYALQANIGEDTSPTCRVVLGSARCGIDIASGWEQTYSIASVSGTRTIVLAGPAANPAGSTYKNGLIELLSGPAAGLKLEVRSWDAGSLTLTTYLPLFILPVAGNSIKVRVGCDKSRATCKTVFANVINFQGEPDTPGIDAIMAPSVTT